MIVFDHEKCVKCGKCIADCGTGVIEFAQDGYPEVADMAGCLHCQHCFAVCPAGAVSYNSVSANEVEGVDGIADTAALEKLMKSRRSVRHYQKKDVPWDVLQRLASTLAYTPTGCNDHKLKLIFVTGEKTEEFRKKTNQILLKIMHSPLGWLMPKRYKRFFKRIEEGEDVIYRGAPAFIVVAVHKKSPCRTEDPLIALTWFELLANSMGLGCCWCGFAQRAFQKFSSLSRMLALGKDYQVGSVILFGYPNVKYHRCIKPENFETTIL